MKMLLPVRFKLISGGHHSNYVGYEPSAKPEIYGLGVGFILGARLEWKKNENAVIFVGMDNLYYEIHPDDKEIYLKGIQSHLTTSPI